MRGWLSCDSWSVDLWRVATHYIICVVFWQLEKAVKIGHCSLGAGRKGFLPRARKEFCVLGFQGNPLGGSSGTSCVQGKGRCVFAKTFCTAGAPGKNTRLYWERRNLLILQFITFWNTVVFFLWCFSSWSSRLFYTEGSVSSGVSSSMDISFKIAGSGIWHSLSYLRIGNNALQFPQIYSRLVYKICSYLCFGKGNLVFLLALPAKQRYFHLNCAF